MSKTEIILFRISIFKDQMDYYINYYMKKFAIRTS